MIQHLEAWWANLGAFKKWAFGSLFAASLAALGTFAVYVCHLTVNSFREWIHDAVREEAYDSRFQERLAGEINKNIVGLSYQAYFTLDANKGLLEHSIPIYVPDGEKVELYLELNHFGAQNQALRSLQLFVDTQKVPVDLNKEINFTRKIILTRSISDAKKEGNYKFSENVLTVVFRADPLQKTRDVVSVKALINVVGLPTAKDEVTK